MAGINLNNIAGSVSKAAGSAVSSAKSSAESAVSSVKSAATSSEGNPRDNAFKAICAVIPGKVSNDTVLKAFELMRKQQATMKKDFSANLKKNLSAFTSHQDVIKANKGYVEDQNKYTDMAYGESTMQYSGCEVFATFNALFNLTGKYPISLPDMISQYEKDGMVMAGKFGTSPQAICDFLNKKGYPASITTKDTEFDALGKKSDSLILTMYNDKEDISKEVHTVNISKENGKFTAHNVYCNGKVVGPYDSVSQTIANINKGKAKGITLIGVNKK